MFRVAQRSMRTRRDSNVMDGLPVWAAIFLMIVLSSPGSTEAVDNVITQWNAITQKVIRTLGLPTQIGARTHALVHISQYKAIQLACEKGNLPLDAAAAYAAHYVLSEIFPAQQSPIFDDVIARQIYPLNLSQAVDREVQTVAFKFAVETLQRRVSDGSQRWAKFKPAPAGSPPGEYQFTPNFTWIAFPQLARTRPFVIRNVREFDIFGGPWKIPSSEYDSDYNVVATIGNSNSPKQTGYQKDTAKFWEYGGNTSGLVGALFNISLEIVGPNLTLKETARLFALQAAAGYDAPIAVWYQKHKYLFWRPITAFRQGDPSHPPNFDFEPLLVSPPESEYPSGHASNAGAWAAVLSKYLGQKDPSQSVSRFVVGTESYFLPERSYASILAPAQEVAMSRVYGGIHFPKPMHTGFELGRKVGEYVAEHFEETFGAL